MQKIKLSVIIPTCNRLTTLPRAVNSVLSQEVEGIEIIIVDDSKVNLVPEITKLIEPMQAGNIRINIFRNSGEHSAARARNYGVTKASGLFITFLDDDDIYLPGRLKSMLKVALEGKYSMVTSGRFYESGDLEFIYLHKRQKFGDITLTDIAFLNDIDIGFMLEKKTFLDLGGFNENMKSLEDWDFIIRHLKNGNCHKIRRLDYAVNIEPNKVRVSNNDSISYLIIADKYRSLFGEAWYFRMCAHSSGLAGSLNLYLVLKYCFNSCSIYPFYCYLRQLRHSFKGRYKTI